MKYFIADLHIGDPNIIMYENRPFNSLLEMKEAFISNWNKKISADDEVFVLGDIGNPKILECLKGKIIVIKGNHDKKIKKFKSYDKPIIDKFLILSHEPVPAIPKESPYLNIHGHLHRESYGIPGTWIDGRRHFCVSAEQINYTPISEEEIRRALNV